MKKLGVCLVGAGRIGNVHARSITYHIPEAELRAVVDANADAAARLAAEYGVSRHGTDWREVLRDPAIEALLVCSPTPTHAEIAIAAMRAGKHVFCEKPVDLTIEKILATKRAAEETGMKLQIGFNRRFDHNHARVRELARSGALGKLELIKITSRDPEPPSPAYAASSGGLYMDMMIHDFDMAMFLAGCEVEEVYATGANLVDARIGAAGDVDTAIVTLAFESGALGVIDNSRRAAYGYDQRVEAFGSLGMAASENDAETSVRLLTAQGVVSDKPRYFFLERYMNSFIEEMRSFVDAVQNDREVAVGIRAGLMSVVLAQAAKRSQAEHRPVKVAQILEG